MKKTCIFNSDRRDGIVGFISSYVVRSIFIYTVRFISSDSDDII